MKSNAPGFVCPNAPLPSQVIQERVSEFIQQFESVEAISGVPLVLLYDIKSSAYYTVCHLHASNLAVKTATDAVLDPDDNEEYKLNRDMYTDTYAYKQMAADAAEGRSFEDIVTEYDTSYKTNQPLKVFGGQHRIKAIEDAIKKNANNNNILHGVRVYFDLTIEQRVNIAIVNNTSIGISNDLLDRMQEEWLGSDLRDWCQSVELLPKNENFADRRSPEGIPTVRIARTLLINYYLGTKGKNQALHTPIVCSSGPKLDSKYDTLRKDIVWDDSNLNQMGKQFAKLHKLQRDRVLGRTNNRHIEFANKAIHPCVAASWAYAAGYFQDNSTHLKAHYALGDSNTSATDPLNAEALLKARLKGVDTDTYRGLGARINNSELGRMLEVFILQASKATSKGVSSKLANAAIQSYEAKKAKDLADKALRGL